MILVVQSEERLPMKFSKLVEFVSKKPLPAHTKHLIVEVMVCDEEGEDVEVRRITVSLSIGPQLKSPFIGTVYCRTRVVGGALPRSIKMYNDV